MGKRRRENPSSRRSTSSPRLPRDVWWDILILLPAKILARFRSVCKEWRSVIDDPKFAGKHRIIPSNNNSNTILLRTFSTAPPFYSVDLDALIIPSSTQTLLQTIPATPARLPIPHGPDNHVFPLATCHGLVFDDKFEIWNPLFSGDRLKLPRVGDGFTLPSPYNSLRGLGYVRATDDYKAVVIDHGAGMFNQPYPTYVYSLRSGGPWRRIGDCTTYLVEECDPGLYLGGALHWMPSLDSDIIVALDLETEEYRNLQTPPLRRCREYVERQREIDVLDGRLVVTDYCRKEALTEAWVLEEPGGSWTKLYSLEHKDEDFTLEELEGYEPAQFYSFVRPLAYTNNKSHIFVQDQDSFFLVDGRRDYYYLRSVSIHGLTARNRPAQPFQETLIRPKHVCGGGEVRERERIMTRMMEKCNTELCFTISGEERPFEESSEDWLFEEW